MVRPIQVFPFSENENTVHAMLQKSFSDYADLPCLGTRKFIKMHKGENEKFPRKVRRTDFLCCRVSRE